MKPALRFVLAIGVVNLFADMTYEGARGEVGAFLGHLGASGLIVGLIAGGGEFVGYVVRVFSGTVADRTGKHWLQVWIGYAINMLSVPALALAHSLPIASTLVVGERFGRGVRRPIVSSFLAQAGKAVGGGWAFGLNEALDQTGAVIGPLIVAFAVARGGFALGFGMLIVPAVLTLLLLAPATFLSRGIARPRENQSGELFVDPAAFRRYAVGGALAAAGFVDFALIAFRFQRDHLGSVASISLWFAGAMAIGAVTAPMFGKLLDRFGSIVVVPALSLTALAVAMAFLGKGAVAFAGAVLWGMGTTVQDALLLALVATVIGARKSTAFGVYDLVFGVSWFAGSAFAGFLADRTLPGLVAFSVVTQLAAVPFFLRPPRVRVPRQ